VAKAPTPLSNGYHPEIDLSAELQAQDLAYYHSLIGVLRWIVENDEGRMLSRVLRTAMNHIPSL
jgi:hypothetical protein